MALRKKRLSGTAIENILQENCSEDDERANAGKLLAKKMDTFKREADLKKKRDKIYRFLHSRGFNAEIIADVIRERVK
jgi:SOS response regulatory protein OraA/RecX